MRILVTMLLALATACSAPGDDSVADAAGPDATVVPACADLGCPAGFCTTTGCCTCPVTGVHCLRPDAEPDACELP